MKIDMGQELRQELCEAEAIRRDISTARGLIQDALTRYVKKKIGARNKKQVEDQAALFAELELYDCREDIHDAFGWDGITEKEMLRLFDLWDAREIARQNSGRYSDRVTELLQRAINGLGEEFEEQLAQADENARRFQDDVTRIERENALHIYERRQDALRREQHGSEQQAEPEADGQQLLR